MKRALPYLSLVLSCIFFIASLGGSSVAYQQQQSGGSGSSVSITAPLPAGTNNIGKFDINSAIPAGGNTIGNVGLNAGGNAIGTVSLNAALPTGGNVIGSVNLNSAIPTGGNAIGSITNTGFNVTGSLPAGTNILGFVKLEPKTTCGDTFFEQAPATLPTAATPVTGTTTCITYMYFLNLTSSPVTITVTDGQGTPVNVVPPGYSIPPNSDVIRTFPNGIRCVSGLKWQAGTASAVVGTVQGWQ